jgi:tight adherence protein B
VRRALPLAAGLLLATAGSAPAALHIRAVDASNYPHVRVTVVTDHVAAKPPALREDGQPAAGLSAENLGAAKSIALLVDRSRSMEGRSLTDAIAAARAFVAAKPAADRIGVFVFGSHAIQLTGFSSATIDADTALRTISVDGHSGTALYDAIALAGGALQKEPLAGRVIILVTDGKDVSSTDTLNDAVQAARHAGAAVYPIGIEGPQFTPDALRSIARRTGGIYRGAATTSVLGATYAAIANELRRTWRFDFLTAGRPGDKVQLGIATPADGSATLELKIPGGTEQTPPGSTLPKAFFAGWGTVLLALIVGGLVLLAVAIAAGTERSSKLTRRVAAHVGQKEARAKPKSGRDRLAALSSIFRATERAFGQTRQWRSVHRLIERADLPLRTVELFYLSAGSGLVLGILAVGAHAPKPVAALVMVAGGFLPLGFVWFKAGRRRNAFEAQLPDLLISLAASLKAGHSFKQGLQSVVDEDFDPSSKELKRVMHEARLGRPLEAGLAEMAERVGSENFAFIVTAVGIQNQVGGSLAGLFDMVADTVRQRQQFARKIRALTAMGRMSAYTLMGLPFFVALAITFLNPSYMAPLYHTSTGHKLIFLGLGMMACGGLALRKIVSFRG